MPSGTSDHRDHKLSLECHLPHHHRQDIGLLHHHHHGVVCIDHYRHFEPLAWVCILVGFSSLYQDHLWNLLCDPGHLSRLLRSVLTHLQIVLGSEGCKVCQ